MKEVFLLVMCIVLCASASASYYADANIRLDATGMAVVEGRTNYPFLNSSQHFTSKEGEYWMFNLTTKENFSDYFISLEMPPGAEVNYIKARGAFRIVEEGSLKIITSGEEEPVELIVQYRLLPKEKAFAFPPVLFAVIPAAILLIFLLKFMPKKRSQKPLLKYALTENQALIVEALSKAKDPVSQKQLLHRTGLPKATLSRNLELLRQKRVIEKESRGMTNVIRLNRELWK